MFSFPSPSSTWKPESHMFDLTHLSLPFSHLPPPTVTSQSQLNIFFFPDRGEDEKQHTLHHRRR